MSREKVLRPLPRFPRGLPGGRDPHPFTESTFSAAARLGLTPRRVRQLIAEGKLEAFPTDWPVWAPRKGRWLRRCRLNVLSDTVTAYQWEKVRQYRERLRETYRQSAR